ncbi:methyltransferase [Legionella geestiana]|uniref:Methyltransferase n=1 Tax=Legionella geestiana TaxID=45065 RepID=A0A0W0U806_9GAMM|nr:class I SAM-dependent methyltransferase [Legionella geestiana]KTD03804.1 methyltransferase [Legionella geestiana]QBS11910.1 class I SAM-dependent methyltransferase [Legionella geestiana]QDQ40477.1 class I SAM-dependent methyltransferase [Legionella geestiana]STX53378.1 methyltransferase [Legionella geestiana]
MPKHWNPEDYDIQSVMQYRTAMLMLDALTLSGNEKILDLGCGTGKITHQIAESRVQGGRIHGIDINADMISFASANYSLDNLSFECNDVLNIDHENEFDVAVSFWTMSWIPLEDQRKAIENIIRSLKDDGHMFLMYPLKHDAYLVVEEVVHRPDWADFFRDYPMPRTFISEDEYQCIVDEIPMEISIRKTELECRYISDDEMKQSINCWLGHVDILPTQALKDKFLSDVVSAYKMHRNTTEPVMYYSTLEISGCKSSLKHNLSLGMQ